MGQFQFGAVLACFLLMVTFQLSQASGRREIQYENFDDYLLSVAAPSHNEVLKAERSTVATPTQSTASSSSSSSSSTTQPQTDLSYEDIIGYFRDVPREHWSCCMLGMLAGNKGFHCHAGFYAARVATRNTNRAQNRALPFHGRNRVPNWGREIMHTFSRCVMHHTQEFHNCCHAATVERRERVRWQQFREFLPVADQ